MTQRLRLTSVGNGRVDADTLLPLLDAINEAFEEIHRLRARVAKLEARARPALRTSDPAEALKRGLAMPS